MGQNDLCLYYTEKFQILSVVLEENAVHNNATLHKTQLAYFAHACITHNILLVVGLRI